MNKIAQIILVFTKLVLCHSQNATSFFREEKGSLVFVFDTTGSMYKDLRQLRAGAEMILNTASEEGNVIADFVFVPFHDPSVGPATVTTNRSEFQAVLKRVRVHGGGDCPEMSLAGVQLALTASRPRSLVYVFTDATAYDHHLVGKVLDLVQRRQSQVVFVLTGHCNDLKKPSYLVYQQIAAASSGQVFNLNKTNVHQVLEFVRTSIKARSVNLGSVRNPAGYNYTQEIPVDNTLSEVTVSVAGASPQIQVFSPTGEQVTGPPKLVTTLDLAEIMVVKVVGPEPGTWSVRAGSAAEHSLQAAGRSRLSFRAGFSALRPAAPAHTSYRPLQGTYNYMLISLTHTDRPVRVSYAEILSLEGKVLFEIPLTEVDAASKTYLAEAFMPPDDLFYISINGLDDNGQEFRRVGATAVQAKSPEVPYLTAPKKVEAFLHETVSLQCDAESLVPVSAQWTKEGARIQSPTSSLQSTSIQYVINNMAAENAGTYTCVAKNVAGVSQFTTEVVLLAEPPVVTIAASDTSLMVGDDLTISCTALTETVLTKYQLVFNGTRFDDTAINVEPNYDGIYVFNKTLEHVTERDAGVYSCIAAHRDGQTVKSLNITIASLPTAQILGPHAVHKTINSPVQLICHVENANEVQWLYNDVTVERRAVNGSNNAMLERAVEGDGVWTCVAFQGVNQASDTVEIHALIKPEVSIEGSKNITVLNGTEHNVTCSIRAKPEPRILWHRETETFLNNTVTLVSPNLYKSVLTLKSEDGDVNGTYFCFGENSEGIHQDSISVSVRREMKLVQGFSDISTQLYSQVTMQCLIDSYPEATITWRHNSTELANKQNLHISEVNSTIVIENADFDDLGLYSCEANNGYEKVCVSGTLSVYGLETPSLSKEPTRRVIRKGEPANLTCSILKGNPKPTLTWLHKSTTEYARLQDVVLRDDKCEVVITEVRLDHTGEYRCVAENVLGRDYYDVILDVQFPPEIESNEVTNDNPMEVEAGQRVTLSCQAQGIPKPIVIWTKDENPLSFTKNVYLTKNSELVIKNATQYDNGFFSCYATSILGSSRKNFTVVVYVPPDITPPGIEPQLEFVEGQLVELPCDAQGLPRPEVTWLQNGNEFNEDRKYIDVFGLRFVANLTDFGEYTCIVKNKYGNTNFTYTVYIWVPPSIEPPLVTEVNVLIGSDVNLNCNSVGFPIPVINWEFQDSIIRENSTDISFNEYGSINITNAESKHEGQYACLAENLVGVARKIFYVHIDESPRILKDNYTGPYIATDKDLMLVVACKGVGKPKPHIYWMKDGVYLDNDSRYEIGLDGALTIKSPSEDLGGEYVCQAKNRAGVVNKTVAVEIYSMPARFQADELESSVTVLEGTNGTVECPIRSSGSDLITWYKDANLIHHGPLSFVNISRYNASSLACVVANAAGSAHARLRLAVEWGPGSVGPADSGALEAARGGDAWMDCAVDANPAATTKWLFNSRTMVGENKDRLKLMNLQLHHAGVYKCIASNKHGTIVKQFSLDILVPPFISEFDLLDVQLKEGMTASLECHARGSPKPEIRWTYNNTSWQLTESSLTTNVSSASGGLFRCSARSRAGAAHLVYRVAVVAGARVAALQVLAEGRARDLPGAAELELGTNVSISCKATGEPLPTIQWIKNGETLSVNRADVSYADLTLNNVNPSHSGSYTCVASNEGGTHYKRLKVDVLEPPKIFQTLFQNSNSTANETVLEVISGQPFFLHCHPYGNPMPEVYWFKDGFPLRLFDESMVTSEFGEVVRARAARGAQAGDYSCVARSRLGQARLDYRVHVLVPPPTPKEASRPVSVRAGRPLTLACPVEGAPVPSVAWVRHPYTDIINTDRLTLSEDNVTLTLHKTETQDSGLYSCVMTNKVGTTEVMFEVTVEKPPSIAGNVGNNITETRIVPLRRSVVLKCEVDGNPMPKITWLKDTQQLSDNDSKIQRVLGNSLLCIWSMSARQAGQYICVAQNSAGARHRRYNVVAQVPGKWSAWSAWGYCDATCGAGHQARARACRYSDEGLTVDDTTNSDKVVLDKSACRGPSSERRKCHMPPCEEARGQWAAWGRWAACSAACGAGTQARTRRCRLGACAGDNVQVRKCPNLPKCDANRDPSNNEVYSSGEGGPGNPDNGTFLPEATFESEPEVVSAEDFHITSVPIQSTVFPVAAAWSPAQGPCPPGYAHNASTQACDDVDECLQPETQCHATQTCVNARGGYGCGCPRGYAALAAGQRCLDVNECSLGVDGCAGACVNTAGGHVCACPRPLRLHADRRSCVHPSSYREYPDPESEYLSVMVESPAKYRNTGN